MQYRGKKWNLIKKGSWMDGVLERQFGSTMFTYEEIFSMLLPLILDGFFINIISMLTTAMISSSSQESVSAVSLVGPVSMLIYAICNAISAGGTVVVAQAKGKGDKEKINVAAGQVMLALPVATFISSILLILFSEPLITALFGAADPVVQAKAKQYLIGVLISMIFISFYLSAFSVLRGIGKTKLCLKLTILINVMHLLASLVFINFMHLDILGSILSLNLARLVCGALAVWVMIAPNSELRVSLKNIFRIDKPIMKQIFQVGIPFALEQLFMNGGAMLVQTYIVLLGTVSMAANAIGSSAMNLLCAAGSAVGILAITVVGQSVGAGEREQAKKCGKQMIVLGTLMIILSLAVLMPLMPVILKLYQAPANTVSLIYKLLITGAAFLPFFWPISTIMPCVMRGAGDAKFSSYFSLISMWAVRVFLGYLFAITFQFGVIGVWLSMGLEWVVRSIVFWIRYRSGIWLKKVEAKDS